MNQELKAGDHAMLKVGRNIVEVEVIRPMADASAFRVKSLTSGKVFIVPGARLEPISAGVKLPDEPIPVAAPKKLTLMQAAIKVLMEVNKPMNTRDMIKLAVERGYWKPTSCKTPEQTLYGSIFREIKTSDHPRIVKSEERGKFTIAW